MPMSSGLGLGFLAVAIMDIFHIYYFPAFSYPQDTTIRFWLIARLLEGGILLGFTSSKIFPIYKRTALPILLFLSFLLCYITINFPNFFPPLMISTDRLSAYKIIGEICIIALLLRVLWKRIHLPDKKKMVYNEDVTMAVNIFIGAEICFMLFDSVFSFMMILGHILKILCHFYLFKGIFISSIIYPYQMLEKSKDDLINILEELPLAFINFNEENRASFVNAKALELFECDYRDIQGLTQNEIRDKFIMNVEDQDRRFVHQSGNKPFAIMYGVSDYYTKSGKRVQLSVKEYPYSKGILIAYDNAKEEQNLSSMKLQTHTILSAIQYPVLISDMNFKVILSNEAFLNCMEAAYEQVIGKDTSELIQELQFTIDPIEKFSEKSRNRAYNSLETSAVTFKGNKRYLLFEHTPVLNIDDEIIGHIGVFTDMTDMKRREQKIRQQEKLALIGQMGAGIVHETKNYLASIKGYCELLLLDIKDERHREYIHRINTINANVNEIITEFLKLSKPTDSVMDIISIHELVNSMAYMLESPSLLKGVPIQIDLSQIDNDIKGDEALLKQVVLNFVKNAIEAMSGTINPLLKISTKYDFDTNEIVLMFSDNGEGISEENMNKLGTPFFTTKNENGTGLGLSTCYKIIHEHNGRIEVESELGEGTTFSIYFPCYDSLDLSGDEEDFGA